MMRVYAAGVLRPASGRDGQLQAFCPDNPSAQLPPQLFYHLPDVRVSIQVLIMLLECVFQQLRQVVNRMVPQVRDLLPDIRMGVGVLAMFPDHNDQLVMRYDSRGCGDRDVDFIRDDDFQRKAEYAGRIGLVVCRYRLPVVTQVPVQQVGFLSGFRILCIHDKFRQQEHLYVLMLDIGVLDGEREPVIFMLPVCHGAV